jgi:hypothetical protein
VQQIEQGHKPSPIFALQCVKWQRIDTFRHRNRLPR